MSNEEIQQKIKLMEESIRAATYVLNELQSDVTKLKGELSKQEDDLR